MRCFFISLIVLSTGCEALSQQLRVLSQKDNKPVAYASIVYISQDREVGGTYTDSMGVAHLTLDSNVNYLQVSHLQYTSTSIGVQRLGEVIYLQPHNNYLEEAVVYPRGELKTSYLGVKRGMRSGGYATSTGIETLTLLENNLETPAWIKSFVFHIKRSKKSTSPVIRIVFYHNEGGKPGRAMPYEIVHSLTENRKGRLVIDLVDEQIIIPAQQGVYAGIEWMGCLGQAYNDTTGIGCSDLIKYRSKIKGHFYVRNKFEGEEWHDLNEVSDHTLSPIYGVEVYHLEPLPN